MRNFKYKQFLFIVSILIVIFFLNLYIYSIIDKRYPGEINNIDQYHGEIENPGKKILNGHLGLFFRFKNLGNINWLIIPLLIWYFTRKKKKEKWQLALLFVWLLTAIFIGIKGYYNVRYQLTLFPITSVMVLILSWEFLKDKIQTIKILSYSFLILLCFYNFFHYNDFFKSYWELRVSLKNPHFPSQLIDYINSTQDINNKSRVLTINRPIFYYHTSKTGVEYVSPHAIKSWVEFKKKGGTVQTRQKLFRFLRRKLKITYILLGHIYKKFHQETMFEEFLHCECQRIIEDQGWLLYRLREKPLEKQLKYPFYQLVDVWNHKQLSVDTLSPSFLRFYKKGRYKYRVRKSKRGNYIEIRNLSPKNRKKMRLQIGYEFNRKGLDLELSQYEGKYVTFIVRTAISPSLVNRDNFIAIVDYNKDGSNYINKTYFKSPYWRTYMVSQKIRPENKRVVLMYRFSPDSPQEYLKIKDVKIVISEEPI